MSKDQKDNLLLGITLPDDVKPIPEGLREPDKTNANTRQRVNVNVAPKDFEFKKSGPLTISRFFTKDLKGDVFDSIGWGLRDSQMADGDGNVTFEQKGVEFPKNWSVLGSNVVASKYFYGDQSIPDDRESSLRQLSNRVNRTIAQAGLDQGYFKSLEDAVNFSDELNYSTIHQYGAFNSPVWFNVGLSHMYGVGEGGSIGNYVVDYETGEYYRAENMYVRPQVSACFIQSVKDEMEDILDLVVREGRLFKLGSGTGTDLSTLRSAKEKLSGGGTPSGPLSFLRIYDQVANVVQSGGKTRRAAKMNSLKVSHPEIEDFIDAKVIEEEKAQALIAQGYDGSFNGEAKKSVFFQNENLSVRVTDEFMRRVAANEDWQTTPVCCNEMADEMPSYNALELLTKMAKNAWICGDPGLQFEDTINRWHTCKASGPINASNPCSEYMFLDDSACNLASHRLTKFLGDDGVFDTETYTHAVETYITAQDILVDYASYPTERIARNSHEYRPLGLGYADLGALLMNLGLAYDSDEGRAVAGAITSIMTAAAYRQSAKLADSLGAFKGYEKNKESMLEVIESHKDLSKNMNRDALDGIGMGYLLDYANEVWDEVSEMAPRTGFRNSQVTVLAPTGTIGFMMDCDTTGVEPDIALVKYKTLAGSNDLLKIVNQAVPKGLKKLSYDDEQIQRIVAYVNEHDTIEGAPDLKPEHEVVFDCAFKPKNGKRFIHHNAHIDMMAEVQSFLSGAISKTVNIPADGTPETFLEVYTRAHEKGLKAIAAYRDGSKGSQPVSTSDGKSIDDFVMEAPHRSKLPNTRPSITHKFNIENTEGYLTIGKYEDGTPGELFAIISEGGSTQEGVTDAYATAMSMLLQYGVSLEELAKDGLHTRFEPSGKTSNPDIPEAKSIPDYICRYALSECGEKSALSEERNSPKIYATPKVMDSKTVLFNIGDKSGDFTVSFYDNGKPAKLDIRIDKEGSTTGGMMGSFGRAISRLWQIGVPLEETVRVFSKSRYEPAGFTGDPDVPRADSLTSYIFKKLPHVCGTEPLEFTSKYLERECPVCHTYALKPMDAKNCHIVCDDCNYEETSGCSG